MGEYFLAMSLANGRGIGKDWAKAMELLRHAANRGYSPAQIALGFQLETGPGAARQPLTAYIWYRVAARTTGNPKLRERAIQGQNRLIIVVSLEVV